jgi:glycerol-3-phosphate cytidylyltransferase-like family protein
MKKVIRLTESDLVRIVKRVISEQPTDSKAKSMAMNKKSITKPGQGGKYCFSDSDLIKEIKNTGNHNIELYRIKQGDTLSHVYEKIDQKEALKTMNPQCDLKSKNGFRVGDVIMMSLLPGS